MSEHANNVSDSVYLRGEGGLRQALQKSSGEHANNVSQGNITAAWAVDREFVYIYIYIYIYI